MLRRNFPMPPPPPPTKIKWSVLWDNFFKLLRKALGKRGAGSIEIHLDPKYEHIFGTRETSDVYLIYQQNLGRSTKLS